MMVSRGPGNHAKNSEAVPVPTHFPCYSLRKKKEFRKAGRQEKLRNKNTKNKLVNEINWECKNAREIKSRVEE